MNGLKLKSCGEFAIGKYRSRKDVLRRKDVKEEQIMAALGKSKTFNVRDWFGSVDLVTFTITNIERDRYGHYIYTIKSSQSVNKDYFPSILEICEDYENVVSPISYSVQWKEIPIK